MSNEKACKGCGKTKPLDDFQKTGKLYQDGSPKYYGKCKLCINEYQRNYRATNPDKKAKFQEINKAWVDSNRDKVNEYQREYNKLNPEKAKASRKKWRESNQDKVRASNRSEKARAASKKWREANPEASKAARDKWVSEHPEYNKAWLESNPDYKTEWNKQNPGAIKQNKRLRKLRLRGAEGSHTLAEWEALKLETGNKCLRCGATSELTRDHIIPITKGGTDNISNIQPLCRNCNSQKSAKTIYYR